MKKRPIAILAALLLFSLACQIIPSGIRGILQVTPTLTATPTVTPTFTPPSPTPLTPAVLSERELNETNDTNRSTITVKYPYWEGGSQSETFNKTVKSFIDQTLIQFRKDAADALKEMPDLTTGSFIDIQYQTLYNANGLLSVQFKVMAYRAGAAHPGSFSMPFNVNLANGRLLELSDLFTPASNALTSLANFCTDEIKKRDAAFWTDGAAAKAENYRSWNITPDGLLITFDEYQVAPYAAGPQQVQVPFAQIKNSIAPSGPLGFLVAADQP